MGGCGRGQRRDLEVLANEGRRQPDMLAAVEAIDHEFAFGVRGASDGTVFTNTIKPTRGPFVPQKPTEVGRLTPDEVRTFAALLCAQRFDLLQMPAAEPTDIGLPEVELAISLPEERFSLRCPSPKLESVYGLAEIGRVFRELRGRFVTA